MTPLKTPPQTPFQFALSQLTSEGKPHVLKTMHGLLTTVLTSTLTALDGNREEQQAESRAIAKFLKDIESELGKSGFSTITPESQQIRYVSPSQLPGAAASTSTTSKKTRRATPRGKSQP